MMAQLPDAPYRVLFTCGREPGYTRNEVLLRALRARHLVTEISDSTPGSLTARTLRLLPRLIPHLRRGDYELIFVGFYGYLLMLCIRPLARCPIIFDAFLSNYDTLCYDRRRFRTDSLGGRVAFWLDRTGCRAANKTLLDTATHAAYFVETFRLPADRLNHVYVGCNEEMFYPRSAPRSSDEFRVLHYSSFLPLHGMEQIVMAAKLLQDRRQLRFRLIGHGMEHSLTRRLARQFNLSNVEFLPPVPYSQLPSEIAAADICLGGPFGDTPKARRIIPGKTFQFLAMARPVVAADTPGNRELLVHAQSAYLVPLADPEALAQAIALLQDEPALRKALAVDGHGRYWQRCSEALIGEALYRVLSDTLSPPSPPERTS